MVIRNQSPLFESCLETNKRSSSLFLLPVVEKKTADEEPFSSSYFVRPCFSKSDALNKQFLGIDDGR